MTPMQIIQYFDLDTSTNKDDFLIAADRAHDLNMIVFADFLRRNAEDLMHRVTFCGYRYDHDEILEKFCDSGYGMGHARGSGYGDGMNVPFGNEGSFGETYMNYLGHYVGIGGGCGAYGVPNCEFRGRGEGSGYGDIYYPHTYVGKNEEYLQLADGAGCSDDYEFPFGVGEEGDTFINADGSGSCDV